MKDAQDLAERLARSRRAGDEFSQGGWHHTAAAPAATPTRFLFLLPFLCPRLPDPRIDARTALRHGTDLTIDVVNEHGEIVQ